MHKPKRRNCNMPFLSSFNRSDFSSFPPPSSSRNDICDKRKESLFGEPIQQIFTPPFYKPQFDTVKKGNISTLNKSKWNSANSSDISTNENVDLDSILSDMDEFKLNTSLSSSPCWSDDNDAECSKKVQDELEHMDRIFRGIDPIPLHYDVDEYKQWMEAFPNLSLFGKKETGQYKIWIDKNKSGEVKNRDAENLPKSKNLEHYKEDIKKAVILNIYENISIRLKKETVPECTLKSTYRVGDVNRTQIYLSDCLKESPFNQVIQDGFRRNSFSNKCNQNEIEKTPRFESLPLVFEDAKDTIMNKTKNHSNAVTIKKTRKDIILPRIDGTSYYSSNFRSISATPTYSSLISAKAMKLENKLLSGKTRDST